MTNTTRPGEEDGGNGKVEATRAFVYVLNRAGVNRWTAQVQSGFDDDDKRISDAECEAIARRIAVALGSAPQAEYSQSGDAWVSVNDQLPDMYDDVLVHPRPTEYCCEAHLTRAGWQYGAYEQYNGHVTSPCTVTHWKRLGAPGAAAAAPSQAVQDVLAERRRQVDVEGWTPEHDDKHGGGSMAFAAAAYAVHAHAGPRLSTVIWNWTGWCRDWWKPKNPRQDFVRAAALLLAEIERIDRAAQAQGGAA